MRTASFRLLLTALLSLLPHHLAGALASSQASGASAGLRAQSGLRKHVQIAVASQADVAAERRKQAPKLALEGGRGATHGDAKRATFSEYLAQIDNDWTVNDSMQILVVLGALITFDIVTPYVFDSSVCSHLIVLGFMVFCSVCFNLAVWVSRGESDAVAWTTGYIVEWALSMDNLFVFHLVFKTFSVPNSQANFALTLGIYGAVVFRVVFIMGLSALLDMGKWVNVVVGAVLILSGIMSLNDDDDEDVKDLFTVRFFKWLMGSRLKDDYDAAGRLFVKSAAGVWQATVLLLVVCIIMVIDVFFAVDSVGSKTGQIRDIYLNLTSSLLAMFSLRALFFLIRDMADYFDLVKYGICTILCFIGADMIFEGLQIFNIHLEVVCVVIAIIFFSSIGLSVLKAHYFPSDDEEAPSDVSGNQDYGSDKISNVSPPAGKLVVGGA